MAGKGRDPVIVLLSSREELGPPLRAIGPLRLGAEDLAGPRPPALIVADFADGRDEGRERLVEGLLRPGDAVLGLVSRVGRRPAVFLDGQGVAIVEDLAGDLPTILGSRTELEQVLVNLAGNALDAMAPGGTLTLRTRRDGEGALRVDVADTGCGIPEDIRSRVFEPFFTTKEVGKGTGLGLSLAYETVRRHGGSIEVESEVGKGTTLSVRLPVAGAPASPEERP